MKIIKEKTAKALIAIAKKGLKHDLESTGSTWNYQPKLPSKQDFSKGQK